MITVIGISGKKQSGKDTLCQLLLDNIEGKGCRVAFADAVKEEVARATGKTVPFVESNKERFRSILQWWGTDYRRYYEGENYWVDKAIIKIDEKIRQGFQLIVIPDVRFESEATCLKDLGAHLVRMARPLNYKDEHISETELDSYKGFHHIVLNNGTVSHLEEEARIILRKCNLPLKQLVSATVR